MRRLARVAALLAGIAVLVPQPAAAQMEMENAAQSQRALTLQALALLDQGRQHEEAEKRLDLALESEPDNRMSLEALRAAHEALHREDAEAAQRLLERAFPKGHSHLVGTTFRPDIAGSRIVAAILGAALLVLAAVALARKQRRDSQPGGAG